MVDIHERFKGAIDSLYNSSCNLATEVTKLGYPKYSTRIPTAAVSWDKKQKQVCFEFNKEFSEKLSDEEFTFVVAHEAMHLAICHIFLIAEQIGKIKRNLSLTEKEKITQSNTFMMKSNIAADCVVNDSLVNIHKLKAQLTDIAVYGKKTVGFDCENLSMMEVYQLLPEAKEYTFDVHDWDTFIDAAGNIDKDFSEKIKGFIERNINNSALSDEENQQLQDVAEVFQNSRRAGDKPLGQRRPVVKIGRNYINWSKLVLDIIDSKKDEDKWSRPNRRLTSIYPDVILPRFDPQEVETVFVAIDASGSINPEQLSLFVDVVRNSPKRFKIEAVTFDTQCYEFDVMNEEPSGGGGTSFLAVENYIQKKFKRYPRAVVCITDGMGDYVNPQFPERWLWLLTENNSDAYCKNMKHHQLRDFLK